MPVNDAPVAVVTGGAGSIGRAIVEALGADHRVAVLDLEGEPPVDLADEEAARAAARAVLGRFGRCDVLVHAAAAMDRAPLEALDLATWRKVQSVNVESLVWLCQELVPAMRAASFGRVVVIVSDTLFSPVRDDMLAYVASKGALVGLARAMAAALGRSGITVNCVAPGLTPTPRSRRA
ncbi:MAG TPA: SDR family oxidoreductase, partial [Acidimicrobiales bacterium]|nr:SDR family oxidoreductase [Acidimicrobiales bacterium]